VLHRETKIFAKWLHFLSYFQDMDSCLCMIIRKTNMRSCIGKLSVSVVLINDEITF
jgi:hypothetical protein